MPLESREGMHLTDVFGRHNFKICCACMIKSAGIKPIEEEKPKVVTSTNATFTETPADAILNTPPKRKAGRPPKARPMSLNDVVNEVKEPVETSVEAS